MNIIRSIQELFRLVREARPVAGSGVVVEHTSTGSIISARVPRPAPARKWSGMFSIVEASDDDGNGFVRVCDTTPAAEVEKLGDGDDGEEVPVYAGVPHVNGVAFSQLKRAEKRPEEEDALLYVYLHFDASSVIAEEEAKAGVADDGGEGDGEEEEDNPCEILFEKEQKKSDFENLYYLIGRVRFGKRTEDGKTRRTVEAISQDHYPGPAYLTWYGPDIGVAEEDDEDEEGPEA